jgi:arylsulfatase A-like enzyme
VPVPGQFEARSLWPILAGTGQAVRDTVYAELARDHIQTGAEYIVMRRDAQWKIVYYLGENDGELYDLATDPAEARNLWHEPAHRARRDALEHDLLAWSMRSTLRSRSAPTRRPQQPMLI